MEDHSTCDCSTDDCDVGMERNRYFTGKYMTARDFQVDPAYFLSRHRLQNRLAFGAGIACGLIVRRHRNEQCGNTWLEITSGTAIDCSGREVVLDCDACIEVDPEQQLQRPQRPRAPVRRGHDPCDDDPADEDEDVEAGPAGDEWDDDDWEFARDERSEWRWRRFAPNGVQVGASTEGYKRKHDCEENARRNLWKDADDTPPKGSWANDEWEFYRDRAGDWRWRRTATNRKIVGASSEGYRNRSDCEANARRHGWQDEGEEPEEPSGRRKLLVCIEYAEEAVEPVPALFDGGGCHPCPQEPNRLREAPNIRLRPVTREMEDRWAGRLTRHDHDDDDHVHKHGHHAHCCPKCWFGDCVPLAVVVIEEGDDGFEIVRIDDSIRRYVRVAGQGLTQIVGTNWIHAEEYTLAGLKAQIGGEFRVRFSRPLREADGARRGINRFTFVVEYRHRGSNREVLNAKEEPYLANGGCDAVFKIPAGFFEECQKTDVRITIKADFLPDCDGIAVDGDFVQPSFPTGDGVPGGTFESWLSIR